MHDAMLSSSLLYQEDVLCTEAERKEKERKEKERKENEKRKKFREQALVGGRHM